MNPTKAPTNNSGFTLVEALVALVIVASVAVLATAGIHDASRAWVAMHATTNSGHQISSFESFARSTLGQAFPPRRLQFDPAPPLIGDERHLEFSGPLPVGVGAAASARYTFSFEPDGTLMVHWSLERDQRQGDDGDTPPNGTQTLLTNVEGGRFAYIPRNPDGKPPLWQAGWNDAVRLPGLVRIRFSRRGHQEEIIVDPALSGADCSAFETSKGISVACGT